LFTAVGLNTTFDIAVILSNDKKDVPVYVTVWPGVQVGLRLNQYNITYFDSTGLTVTMEIQR